MTLQSTFQSLKKAQDKIEDKYADAEEKYKLNDPDFKATKTTLYENFFRNEEEDYNNDGKKDGTIRVFAKTKNINLACMLQGSFPQKADLINEGKHYDVCVAIGPMIMMKWCKSHEVGYLVLGSNKFWKQEVDIDKRNNQNFVSIPFEMLKSMIELKSNEYGITVIRQEESYTSKASFLDLDFIPVYNEEDL